MRGRVAAVVGFPGAPPVVGLPAGGPAERAGEPLAARGPFRQRLRQEAATVIGAIGRPDAEQVHGTTAFGCSRATSVQRLATGAVRGRWGLPRSNSDCRVSILDERGIGHPLGPKSRLDKD